MKKYSVMRFESPTYSQLYLCFILLNALKLVGASYRQTKTGFYVSGLFGVEHFSMLHLCIERN